MSITCTNYSLDQNYVTSSQYYLKSNLHDLSVLREAKHQG